MAICAIGKALESLQDPEARLRVLRWANERFQLASTEPSANVALTDLAPAPVPPVPALRLATTVESAAQVLHLAPAPAVDLEPAPGPQIGLALGLELEPAVQLGPEADLSVDSLEDLFDLEAPVGLSPAPIAPQLHLVSREEQPFEELIDDFVESLRRLTRECLDV